MFSTLQEAPPDAILGLAEAFRSDKHEGKINLTTGVFKDDSGKTPVLSCVKKAEERLLRDEDSKSYLAIGGDPEQTRLVQELIFGSGHPLLASGQAVTVQTPGGTGALRVASDFVRQAIGPRKVWLSEPTWPNHGGIFESSGHEIKTYPYYDAASKTLNFESMIGTLEYAEEGDIVVLHACCHNPSGMDPNQEQWARLAELTKTKKLAPFFDFAYQGFGDGLEPDAEGVRKFLEPGRELFIATSYSKNFGLYNERVGALTIVANSKVDASAALSHVKRAIRSNYSNPPAHGGKVVAVILSDPALRAEWETELVGMCTRINETRTLFADTLKAKGVPGDFSFICHQRGMFSFSGLTKPQVITLRENYGIYMVESGRINVAGITPSNVDRLCECIAEVVNG